MTSFPATFAIGRHRIGVGHSVFVIAEAGVAHFGDPDKADALVDLAASAGADAFKTQAFITDDLVSGRLPDWRNRLRPKEVDYRFLRRMKDRCVSKNLTFLCTAHTENALRWIDDLDVPAYKVGSGERDNVPYLRALGGRGKPVILSTGMYEEPHVHRAVAALADGGCRELALLHCVTSYPVPPEQVNLRVMDRLAEIFPGPVGYSDHTRGYHVPLAAVARGARIIEKHITIDYDVPDAQDWKVSCGPGDLAEFIKNLREIEVAIGSPTLAVQPCEAPALNWALKSLVAREALPAGTTLTAEMLIAKRPGDGLPPSELDRIVGRRLKRALAVDEPVQLADLDA